MLLILVWSHTLTKLKTSGIAYPPRGERPAESANENPPTSPVGIETGKYVICCNIWKPLLKRQNVFVPKCVPFLSFQWATAIYLLFNFIESSREFVFWVMRLTNGCLNQVSKHTVFKPRTFGMGVKHPNPYSQTQILHVTCSTLYFIRIELTKFFNPNLPRLYIFLLQIDYRRFT